MVVGFANFLPLILISCLIILGVVLAACTLKGRFKNVKEKFSHFKEGTSHFTGENSKNAGTHWLIYKWFAIGAVVMYVLGRHIFFPIFSLPAILGLQAAVVYFITRKDEKNRVAKREWYSIGAFFGLVAFILTGLIKLGGSEVPEKIMFHFALILIFVLLMAYKAGKVNVLKNDTAVRQTTGVITRHVILNHTFLFFTYAKGHSYEYEFNANGLLYKGVDGETNGLWKKRGGDLQNPVKVIYEMDSPKNSCLKDIKHRGMLTIILVTIFCSALIVLHCIMTTDVVDIAKNVFAMILEAYGE